MGEIGYVSARVIMFSSVKGSWPVDKGELNKAGSHSLRHVNTSILYTRLSRIAIFLVFEVSVKA